LDWNDVRIFLAIARAGTLGGAAKALGQTQPTMGRRLKALEEAVGHALFQRTGDGFVLTDEGAAVLAGAERMEKEATSFERQLSGQASQLEGVLRVSSSDWFGAHVLTEVIAEYSRRHPAVTVELITDHRWLSLARREADLVFRIREFEEVDVLQRKLIHMEYGLYGSTLSEPPVPGDGRGLRLVTLDAGFSTLPDVTWLHETFPHATTAFRSNSREAQAKLCAAGIGVAVLPCMLAERIGGLRRFALPEPPPGRDVWVGYHRDLRRLGRLRTFLDLAVAMLKS
jgi:DNA-binding transcriptional LysR family regulator